jgi:integrase
MSSGKKPGTNKKQSPSVKLNECYLVNNYRRVIQRSAQKAGVEKWSPNQLRHSATTELRAEFGIEAAQVQLIRRQILFFG